ncbi:hypothetical protein CY652_14865 [Burkholderia sp. WAC0059]|nr:hypothetical protein CY652_14865 [Burkholderia sp. WAC0059]
MRLLVEVRPPIGRNGFAMLDRAAPFLYRARLPAGVQIAGYGTTMLHGKVAASDSKGGTVGSSNPGAS